jgi:YesN/AraC family two-component response regulator
MLEQYFSDPGHYIKYHHKRNSESVNWDYHLHDYYEIYYLRKGNINYFIGTTTYHLKPGDLVLINSNEIHTHSLQEEEDYDRIFILFDPKLLVLFESQDYPLLDCFHNRNRGEGNKVSMNAIQIEELIALFQRMEGVKDSDKPGSKQLLLSYMIELLVLIGKAYQEQDNYKEGIYRNEKLLPVLNYIEDNIDGDLSLETLEKIHYINRYYLSRLFKESVGISLHKYIILKRIIMAKSLLLQGYDVTSVCYMSGFHDYSNFIKMFKNIVGVSPAKYKGIDKRNF